MKNKLPFLILPLLFVTQTICAQDSLRNAQIAAINALVSRIDSDTTLIQVKIDNGWSDTLKNGAIQFHFDTLGTVTAYYKNKKIQKITNFYHGQFLLGKPTSYYYNNDKLVYVSEVYMDCSRMGSCGCLDIDSYYYLHDNTIISSKLTESPFQCYNEELKNKEELFNELAKILRRLEGYLK